MPLNVANDQQATNQTTEQTEQPEDPVNTLRDWGDKLKKNWALTRLAHEGVMIDKIAKQNQTVLKTVQNLQEAAGMDLSGEDDMGVSIGNEIHIHSESSSPEKPNGNTGQQPPPNNGGGGGSNGNNTNHNETGSGNGSQPSTPPPPSQTKSAIAKYAPYLIGASIPLAAWGGYGLRDFTDTDTDTRETVDFQGGIRVQQPPSR